MDPFPYNSTCDDAGKEFFVRNIPVNFIDWDLFHIFYKYGTVHNVKIPEKQTMATKYGFVVMEDLNSADKVRCHLINGKYLFTDDGLQLLVNTTRSGERQFYRVDDDDDDCSNTRNSLRKLQVVDDTLLEKKYDEEPNSSKIEKPWLGVKCYSQDLPLKTPTKVRVVESPYPCRCVEDGFVFHIIPDAQQLGEEYADLQRTMNQFCSENPNLQDLPMIGQYALFGRSNIAYRAVCIGDMTMYLVDTGEIVPMELSHLWSFDVAFLELPTLIIPCGISDIAWIEPSVVLFNTCLEALRQWSASYGNGLTATATHYSGLVNMVSLEAFSDGIVENFATFIMAKGLCTRLSRIQCCYSRKVLLAIRDSFKDGRTAPPVNFTNFVGEIIKGSFTVPVS